MIPKKIHYCWFGKGKKPRQAIRCIDSWKKNMPDYEIIEWNENNYDVHKVPYIDQAYAAKKYAFVSDYARFDILYREGGVYFDTDVEVIKSFNDILEQGAFFGCEVDGSIDDSGCSDGLIGAPYSSFSIRINPGLGMATEKGNQFYKEFLDMYEDMDFFKPDGSINSVAVVRNTTNLLCKFGLKDISGLQEILGIYIYPSEYFNPLDSMTGEITMGSNTHSIHWYAMSWMNPLQRTKIMLGRIIRNLKMR